MIEVRQYRHTDYDQVESLYRQRDAYGGEFSQFRDSEGRLNSRTVVDPESIFVAEQAGRIVGTISIIEDGRVAWLYRFAVSDGPDSDRAARYLSERALKVLESRGHEQVLVYAPADDKHLSDRYADLGFTRGGSYVCYFRDTRF
jgi:predicted N-acetyltransferase YhbS